MASASIRVRAEDYFDAELLLEHYVNVIEIDRATGGFHCELHACPEMYDLEVPPYSFRHPGQELHARDDEAGAVAAVGHCNELDLVMTGPEDLPKKKSLSGAGAAFCIYELSGTVSPDELTADFVYVRLHGPDGAYQGKYSTRALKDWARAFSLWSRKGKDIYCYFDNDQAGYAVHDALKLRELVEAGTRRKKVKRGR